MPDGLPNLTNYANFPLSPSMLIWKSFEYLREYLNLFTRANVYWLMLMLLWFMSIIKTFASTIPGDFPQESLAATMEMLEMCATVERDKMIKHRAWWRSRIIVFHLIMTTRYILASFYDVIKKEFLILLFATLGHQL